MHVRPIYLIVVATLMAFAFAAPSSSAEPPCPPLLDHKFANLMDEPISLCQFRGKVVLIVNEYPATAARDPSEPGARSTRVRGDLQLTRSRAVR
jgi:hypothetical protein